MAQATSWPSRQPPKAPLNLPKPVMISDATMVHANAPHGCGHQFTRFDAGRTIDCCAAHPCDAMSMLSKTSKIPLACSHHAIGITSILQVQLQTVVDFAHIGLEGTPCSHIAMQSCLLKHRQTSAS